MAAGWSLTVNGQDRALAAGPDAILLDVLREELGLKAARFGCGEGLCGSCRVLVDGRPVPACNTPLWSVAGKSITTVEGLGTPDAPHPIQTALIAEQAMQCGYCISGIVIGAAALLKDNPDPDETSIRKALDPHLCRCGAHNRIVRAVARRRAVDAGRCGVSAAAAAWPPGLAATPMLDRWLSVSPEGYVTLTPGKVEIGQGILTALAQICADELDIAIERVRMVAANTAGSPNEGVTSGSLSVSQSGLSVRHVAAQVRGLFLAEAARRFAIDADALSVEDGAITGPGNLATSYWELAERVCLTQPADPEIRPKTVSARVLAGYSTPRIDIPGKVFATRPFIHDLAPLGLLHGRVLRPARPGATLRDLDASEVEHCAGLVALVRDGSFVGVVCESEALADAALAALAGATRWHGGLVLPDEHDLYGWLKAQACETQVV